MFKQITLLAVAGLASAASIPTRYASVYNNCKFDVTVFTATETVSDGYRLGAGEIYTHGYPQAGEVATAYKITRGPDGLAQGEPQLIFTFGIDGDEIKYDLSEAYGNAFEDFKIDAGANSDSCPRIVWENGVPPGGDHSGSCDADISIAVGLCL